MLTKAKRDAWVRALRSGEYDQGQTALEVEVMHFDTENNGYYSTRTNCCLGVLVYATKNHVNPDDLLDHQELRELGNHHDLARDLSDYAFHLEHENYEGKWHREKFEGEEIFAHMNDNLGWSFNRIANVVENLPTYN